MTLLMTWNIQFFSEQNFSNATRASSLSASHIVDSIKAVDPDILMVIEVRSGGNLGIGSLITDTGGAQGVLALRERLGGSQAGWWVVPPQVLNAASNSPYTNTQTKYYEGIAVFFRDRNLDFIGPWMATQHGPRARNLAAPPPNIQAYTHTWAGALPHTVPAAVGFRNHYQDEFAGQVFFSDVHNQALQFPASWARVPFLTAFWDKQNSRVIKLLGVHLPPQYTWSSKAMPELGKIDLLAPIPSDSPTQDTSGACIITGDFNINALNLNQVGSYAAGGLNAYTLETTATAQSTLIRRPNSPAAPAVNVFANGERGWWKRDRQQGVYVALDAMLGRYYGPNGNGPVINYGVRDWVRVSKPSTFPPNPHAYMAQKIQDLRQNLSGFKGMWNYTKMRDASDHLAITADI